MYFSPPLFFSFCPISPVISPHLFRPPHHPDNTLFSYLADYKVPAHAAAALINFCDGVERDTLIPYLGPIVGQLFKHLNPASLSSTNTDANGAGNENGMGVRRYVQEQVITTLAMVAGASEDTFAQVGFSPFPLVVGVRLMSLTLVWILLARVTLCLGGLHWRG